MAASSIRTAAALLLLMVSGLLLLALSPVRAASDQSDAASTMDVEKSPSSTVDGDGDLDRRARAAYYQQDPFLYLMWNQKPIRMSSWYQNRNDKRGSSFRLDPYRYRLLKRGGGASIRLDPYRYRLLKRTAGGGDWYDDREPAFYNY